MNRSKHRTFQISLHPVFGAASLALAGAVASVSIAGDGFDPVIGDEIIVMLSKTASLESVIAELAPHAPGLVAEAQIPRRPIHRLVYELEGGEPPESLAAALEELVLGGSLLWGEFGYQTQTGEGRTDSLWVTGVGLGTDAFENQFARDLLGLGAAHLTSRGEGVLIAIADTGLDASHPLLASTAVLPGIDLLAGGTVEGDPAPGLDGDADGLVDEMAGHGTFIASLVHLVAPEAALMPIRTLDSEGRTDNFTTGLAIAAAIDAGVDILNMSLGSTYRSDLVEALVEEAHDAGIVVVASIGNLAREEPEEYPAADGKAFAIAATDRFDVVAPFTNFGEFAFLSAPGTVRIGKSGVDVAESVLGAVPDGVGAWQGTSFATAFASGVAALVRAQHPSWPNAEVPADAVAESVMARLATSAVPIDPINPGFEGLIGAGRIDAAAAVALGPPAGRSADLNHDGRVDGIDLGNLLSHWGDCTGCPADLDHDGQVAGTDLAQLLAQWLTNP